MLPYYVAVGLGYSIVIAAAIGLMRYKSILPAYRPFIYIILLGFLDHNLSVVLNETIRNNAVNSNIYVLLESLLYLWFFKNLGGFFKRMTVFYFLFIFLIIVWGYDNLIRNDLSTTNSLFRIVYSFVLIFLSIEQLNKAISTVRKNIIYHSIFVICCGIIIYFSYKATTEVFYFIRLKATDQFYINITVIMVFINCFVNLLFAWAVLWIPKKQKYTLPH